MPAGVDVVGLFPIRGLGCTRLSFESQFVASRRNRRTRKDGKQIENASMPPNYPICLPNQVDLGKIDNLVGTPVEDRFHHEEAESF